MKNLDKILKYVEYISVSMPLRNIQISVKI